MNHNDEILSGSKKMQWLAMTGTLIMAATLIMSMYQLTS